MNDLVEHYRELLRRAYGGRRWVLAMDTLASMRTVVDDLRELGGTAALCVAATRGVGELPDEGFAPGPVVLGVKGHDMMSSVRAALAAFSALGPDAVEAVDAFDPAGEALVLGSIFDNGGPVAGRRKYGARPETWQALEDKTTIDALWDALGVPRSPSRVVDADDIEGLREAAAALDMGAQTVWAADNREGFHGGASFTRWVRTDEDFEATQRFFAAHADRIRVMPFLEGIPCSIHGIVFPDDVVVLRPCEMIVFRCEDGSFHYGKAATFWDPRSTDRAQMRELAGRVGVQLRERFGYRGTFTIDGVMSEEGFRPTELNPRFGAALGILARPVALPMMLLNQAVVEGEPFDWRPRDLEALLLGAADKVRSGGTMAVTTVAREQSERVELAMEPSGEFRRCRDGEPADATLLFGPAASGSTVLAEFDSDRTPVGDSVAPRAAALLRWADAEYDLGLGVLTPAREVRR